MSAGRNYQKCVARAFSFFFLISRHCSVALLVESSQSRKVSLFYYMSVVSRHCQCFGLGDPYRMTRNLLSRFGSDSKIIAKRFMTIRMQIILSKILLDITDLIIKSKTKILVLVPSKSTPEQCKDDAIHADMGLYYTSEMLP